MRRTTHLLSGMAVGALAASAIGRESIDLLVVGAAFGVLPDMDLILSRLSRKVHRSPASHSLMASFAAALAWAFLLWLSCRFWNLGFLEDIPVLASSATAFTASFVHTVEDSFTLQGCKALYPLSRRVFRGPVRYDDLLTNAALSIVAAAVIVVSIKLDPSSPL